MKRIPALVAASALVLAACGAQTDDAPDDLRGVRSISAGTSHTCLLAEDGTAWCWGENYRGEVGDGTLIPWFSPHAVAMPEGVRLSALDAGPSTTCALSIDGDAWCWGSIGGSLWDRDRLDIESNPLAPVAIPMPQGISFSTIDVGAGNACALTSDGEAWCWGSVDPDGYGQPPSVIEVPDGLAFEAVTSATDYGCGVAADASLWCWSNSAPRRVASRKETAATFSPVIASGDGQDHRSTFCAGASDGGVWCWVGDEDPSPEITGDVVFSDIAVAPSSFAVASGSEAYGCGVSVEGEVRCWGEDSPLLGDIRDSNGIIRAEVAIEESVLISLPQGRAAVTVAAGWSHACAAASDGSYWCWGDNEFGQLGVGSREQDYRYRPVEVLAPGTSPIAAPGYLEPTDLPWEGPIPLWGLGIDETADLFPEWDRLAPSECQYSGDAPPAAPFGDCFGRFLVDRGVSLAAAEFYRETSFAVDTVWGEGAVRTVRGVDWSTRMGTGFSPPDYAVVTPQGVVNQGALLQWASLSAAMREANRDPILDRIIQGTGYQQSLSWVRYIGAPEETSSGWTVRVAICTSGMSQCWASFAAWFAIEFSAQGVPQSARYLTYCWDLQPEGWEQSEGADFLRGLYEELPRCDIPES